MPTRPPRNCRQNTMERDANGSCEMAVPPKIFRISTKDFVSTITGKRHFDVSLRHFGKTNRSERKRGSQNGSSSRAKKLQKSLWAYLLGAVAQCGPSQIDELRARRWKIRPHHLQQKPTENVRTGLLQWRAISATSRDESIPPDKNAPIGTSLIICRLNGPLEQNFQLEFVRRHMAVASSQRRTPVTLDHRLGYRLNAIRIGFRARASERP